MTTTTTFDGYAVTLKTDPEFWGIDITPDAALKLAHEFGAKVEAEFPGIEVSYRPCGALEVNGATGPENAVCDRIDEWVEEMR